MTSSEMQTPSDLKAGVQSEQSAVLSVIGCILMWGLHSFLLVMTLFVFAQVIPIFTEYFDQKQVQLSSATQLVIIWSVRCSLYWPYLLLVGVSVDGAIVGLLTRYTPRRLRLASVYSQLLFFAVCFLFVFLIVALALPVHDLSEAGKFANALRAVERN